MNKKSRWAIRPQVPDEVYTDRREFIDYFVQAAREAIARRTMSTVLLGQRRMGKTEIFKRVVNHLFFEQDHDGAETVVPIYFSFPEEVIDRWDFAMKYVENFVRWYAAFRTRNPDMISDKSIDYADLPEFIRTNMDVPKGFSQALHLMKSLRRKGVILPEDEALNLPRLVSDLDDSTIVMFLDEFQNTHLPQYDFRVVGFMQNAVESSTCPHFVTGSATGILKDILGRGALFGRFMSHPIGALTNYYGEELALRAARYYGATISQEMAPVVSERCGGNPFYITAVVRQAAKQGHVLASEETLNELLAVDLSSGFIWAELSDQVTRWIARMNEYGITKWILYLAALEEGRIDPERIQQELERQENREVDLETIKDILVKLSRGDLVDYKELGGWFSKVNDPILEEFLKVWGKIEVVGESRDKVREETIIKYQKLQKKFAEHKGYLAEVYMIQTLWNSQRKILPGAYFHSPEDIQMPDRFIYIDHRSRMGAGKGMEIDIYAAAGLEVWIAESKWWSGHKVGRKTIERLLEQAKLLEKRKGKDLETLRLWLFAHDGVTEEAEALMRQHHVLWSTRADLDALLTFVNLRTLPEI
ncbi:MAG: hypothetical protein ISS49_00680 [Anaerolineae bacterium]|nr:hypothetical protein [Anaerolineae bacterium]